MTQELKLYHYWRSSCSWRVRWALAYKNISYESIAVNLLKSEQVSTDYLQKNPSGFVPCLMVDGKPMGESLAMLEWLEEVYPAQPLLPSDPLSRSQVRQMTYCIAAGTQPIQNLKVQKYISANPTERQEFARHWIVEGFRAYELLLHRWSGSFSYGGQLSFADLCLVPQVYNALRFNVDMTPFPKTLEIYNRCRALDSCQLAEPENQKGASK